MEPDENSKFDDYLTKKIMSSSFQSKYGEYLKKIQSVPDENLVNTSGTYDPYRYPYTSSRPATTTTDVSGLIDQLTSMTRQIVRQSNEMMERLERMEKAIGILSERPSEETLNKHIALREMYEAYKAAEVFFLSGE